MSEAQPVAVAEPEMIAVAHAVNDEEVPPAEGALVPAEVAMGDLEDNPMDSAEEKRVKRMRRNRESAAQSRNRKKQYVDSLEGEIGGLRGKGAQKVHAAFRSFGQAFVATHPVSG